MTLDYTILAPPRISPVTFGAVLTAAKSPAAPRAADCFSAITAYGVDPAVALAVFGHESSYGAKGRAVANRSWGNLRTSPNFPSKAGFVVYPSWVYGANDAARLLAIYGHNAIRPGTNTSTARTFP